MSGLKNGDQQLREEIEALKATHDASKLGQIKQLEQYDAQVCSELNRLHEVHAAIHDHLGRQADEHSSAMESGLQNIDAQLRAEIEALKATHDSIKADQIVALERYYAQVRGELIKLHEGHAAIHDRFGQHADDHSAAMESGLQYVDAQLRAEINALKATHDESKIG